jgi:hypothetical protein
MMLTGTTILASALILASSPAMGPKTDLLVFANGDEMTCEIKSLSAGALYVGVDYVSGTISIEWAKVVRLQSPQLFIIKTNDGSPYAGRISTVDVGQGQPAEFRIDLVSGGQIVIPKSQIAEMSRTSAQFFGRLNGNITTSLIYTKGNNNTQFSFGTTVEYPRPTWGAQVTYNSNFSTSSGTAASTRNNLTLSGTKLTRWKNLYYAAYASGLQSTEQGIDLQSNLGGGVGYYIKNTNRLIFATMAGGTWQNTTYTPGVSSGTTESIATGLLAVTFGFVRFNKTNLSIRASALPDFSTANRWFFNTNASYYFKFWGKLNWNLSFYGNWDTKPPQGYSGSDYGFSSGLGWTFGSW